MMEKVGAKGHVTFGGRLPADAKGFPASAMAKGTPVTGATSTRPGLGPEVAAEMSANA